MDKKLLNRNLFKKIEPWTRGPMGVTKIILVGFKISFVTTRSNIEKEGLAHKKSGALAFCKLSTGSTKRDQS